MAKVYAYMTGDRTSPESAEHGSFEETGWVDPWWNMRTLFESRNDVRPVMEEYVPHDDLPDVLRPDAPLREIAVDVLDRYLGAYETSDGSTFYGADSQDDYETGDSYSYAIHFVIKDQHGERDWHPLEYV